MKLKRWDSAENMTPRLAAGLLWYSIISGRPRSVYITIRAIVRAAMLKLGLAKPYEWEEFEDGRASVTKHLFPLMLASMLVTGCTTTRWVTVPCLTKEQVDERQKAEPPLVGKDLTGDAAKDIRPIAGSAIDLRAWGRGNLKILEGCTG